MPKSIINALLISLAIYLSLFYSISNTQNNILIQSKNKSKMPKSNITSISESQDWMVEGNQVDGLYGGSVSSAGDVNGDGYSDILVGSSYYTDGEQDEGAAFVYYGSSSGLSTTADWMVEGNQVGGLYGGSVSSAGDVNGDGYSCKASDGIGIS